MQTKSKVLIIFAHPETKSFCAAVKDKAVETLTRAGHEVKVSDLYRMKMFLPIDTTDFTTRTQTEFFKPQAEQTACNKKNFEGYSAEVKAEHEKIKWCDTIIFVFPMYWWSMPGIMKNWVDRMLTLGFAYGMKGEVSLKPRKAMIMYTTGGPKSYHESSGMQTIAWKLIHGGIFGFCGLTTLEPCVLYAATSVSEDQRKKYLEEVKTAMDGIDARKQC